MHVCVPLQVEKGHEYRDQKKNTKRRHPWLTLMTFLTCLGDSLTHPPSRHFCRSANFLSTSSTWNGIHTFIPTILFKLELYFQRKCSTSSMTLVHKYYKDQGNCMYLEVDHIPESLEVSTRSLLFTAIEFTVVYQATELLEPLRYQ